MLGAAPGSGLERCWPLLDKFVSTHLGCHRAKMEVAAAPFSQLLVWMSHGKQMSLKAALASPREFRACPISHLLQI